MDNYLNENLTQTDFLMVLNQESSSYGQNLSTLSLSLIHNSSESSFNETDFYENMKNISESDTGGRILNITKSTPLKYAMVMYSYIMPFLLILKIVANTLIVLVLVQKHMRTPTNLVLMSMAIADMLTLLFPSPWYFYFYTLGYYKQILHPPLACYAYSSMIETVPMFFHTASIWLTILLAGQRYHSIRIYFKLIHLFSFLILFNKKLFLSYFDVIFVFIQNLI